MSPLPLRLSAPAVRGFGRGSRELGIPTANLPPECLPPGAWEALEAGIYWGWAGLLPEVLPEGGGCARVFPAAISVGFNPTYGNAEKTLEPHFICAPSDPHRGASRCGESQMPDFYGRTVRLAVCGRIRDELKFEGLDKLVEWIKNDIKVTEEKCGSEGEGCWGEREWCRSGEDV
jgi:riboflavin kinase